MSSAQEGNEDFSTSKESNQVITADFITSDGTFLVDLNSSFFQVAEMNDKRSLYFMWKVYTTMEHMGKLSPRPIQDYSTLHQELNKGGFILLAVPSFVSSSEGRRVQGVREEILLRVDDIQRVKFYREERLP